VEAHALREQGWTISAIARHLGHDRKTVRAYLEGRRVPEVRVRREATVAEPFLEYCRLRLVEDPHLWASTLHDELVELGFTGSYPSLTAAIRTHRLRPHCEPCQASKGRDSSIITHPAGEETQWDWVELPNPPTSWGLGREAHLLVGSLAHSGRWRAVLADCEDFPHLIEALDRVTRKLGGLTRRWRFDRMATVCSPATGTVSAAFAQAAKHYAVGVDLCPPRHGNRKGVVEKANHSAAQRWWRTVADDATVTAAGQSLDELCERLDRRTRRRNGQRVTVAELAAGEGLRAAPTTAYPAELAVARTVSARRWCPSAGTGTRCRRGCPAPRSSSATASAPSRSASSPLRARPSRSTTAPPTAPERPSATTATSGPWKRQCCGGSPTPGPAGRRPGVPPARPRGPKRPGCAGPRPRRARPSGS
jgi:transposase